ncbi:hypothetical protein SAY87_013255 [Trapa incisa]|uniref:Uncharacterized protein n=1 Tax=Trapa incisa TaxID=236973 RepID=A0AAN7QCU2_9MYRT|nr:hypothetical protein SAY87_013255 [Trapa incisa]
MGPSLINISMFFGPNVVDLLFQVAKELDRYIVPECDSVEVFYGKQHFTSTPEQSNLKHIPLEQQLPMTWYPHEYLASVSMTNMAMKSSPSKGCPGRTYRFYDGLVVCPFGHGLSYTSFIHSIVSALSVFIVPLDDHRTTNTSTLDKAIKVTHTK